MVIAAMQAWSSGSAERGPSMRTRRYSATIILVLLGTLILAACGSPSAAQPTPSGGQEATASSGAPSAASAQPSVATGGAPADTLRWSLEGISDLSSIDPAKPGDAPAITAINLIFGGLIRLNDKLEVEPDGASEWKVSQDGTTYTFTIRDGLKFADGTPVTAGDFVYSINRAPSPDT